jgi:hydroxyisourate hydrolase
MTRRLSVTKINALDRDAFVACFGAVFEHSPWVAEAAWESRPFTSTRALLDAMLRAVREAPDERQMALIKAHPDLGGKLAMSDASTREQQGAGLDRLTPAEYEELSALNRAYAAKFGFPFILAVRGKSKAEIVAAMRARVGRSAEEEREEALRQIGRIAAFRLADLVEEADGTGAGGRSGRLTTHVLDLMRGRPAAGMRIELYRLGEGGAPSRERIREAATNADGRTDEPLLAGEEMRAGVYELVFHAGDYFRAVSADIGFLTEVPVRFRIGDPNAHYHVPLLAAPGGYSTYRGS